MQRLFVILVTACLLCLTPHLAFAEYDNEEDSDCPGDSCDAPPERDGDIDIETTVQVGGDRTSIRVGGDRINNTSSADGNRTSVRVGGDRTYVGGDRTSIRDGDVTVEGDTFEAADVKGAAKELKKRAAQAARVTAGSSASASPCGDHTGLSLSTGVAGGGLGTITEACRAYRATLAEVAVSAKKGFAVKAQYWIGFPFRLVLHVVTFGVLN